MIESCAKPRRNAARKVDPKFHTNLIGNEVEIYFKISLINQNTLL